MKLIDRPKNQGYCTNCCIFAAENSTVTESEMDTEADTDRESVVDRLTVLYDLRAFVHLGF